MTSTVNDVAYGNGRFIAVSQNGGIYSSDDGADWDEVISPGGPVLSGVCYGSDRFVAVGAAGTIKWSLSGASWTTATAPKETGSLIAVAYGSGTFVASQGDAIIDSQDGMAWNTQVNPKGNSYVTGLLPVEDEFLAVGRYISFSGGGGGTFYVFGIFFSMEEPVLTSATAMTVNYGQAVFYEIQGEQFISYYGVDGPLPEGLVFDGFGTISGTPKRPGKQSFVVTATNPRGVAAQTVTIDVRDKVAPGLKLKKVPAMVTLKAGMAKFTVTATDNYNPAKIRATLKEKGKPAVVRVLTLPSTIAKSKTFTFSLKHRKNAKFTLVLQALDTTGNASKLVTVSYQTQ
jgi:hypothetical protein